MTINLIKYKQFFTPKKYSQLLIENIDFLNPIKIIDLTMGDGSLLLEASNKWNQSQIFGNDIDSTYYINNTNLHFINFYNKDIFLTSTINFLIQEVGQVDICLANPPFYLVKKSNYTKKILDKFPLYIHKNTKYISSEILFILQALQILKKDGILSIILPDGFFVNNSLQGFREFILKNYKILQIIELPIEIFKYTKAKTHIMILQNTSVISQSIKLCNTVDTDYRLISIKEAILRMDYSFYTNKEYNNLKKLSDFDIEVIRGIPKWKLKEIRENWTLHTTNFRNSDFFNSPLKTTHFIKKYIDKIAKKNDIIIPRVGSNILGRVGIVKSGYFIATDCIFIIRVRNKTDRENIKYTLESEFGKEWIHSISKGVGARHITLQDIAKLPILERAKNNDNRI